VRYVGGSFGRRLALADIDKLHNTMARLLFVRIGNDVTLRFRSGQEVVGRIERVDDEMVVLRGMGVYRVEEVAGVEP